MFLEHVNLTVQDLDRSVAFYRKLFGYRVRWQGKATGGEGLVPAAHVGDDRCYLALFQAEQPGAVEEDYGHAGFNHLGIAVEDLAAVRERAVGLGVEPHFEPEYEPGRRFYVRDPDGIEIEIIDPAG